MKTLILLVLPIIAVLTAVPAHPLQTQFEIGSNLAAFNWYPFVDLDFLGYYPLHPLHASSLSTPSLQ